MPFKLEMLSAAEYIATLEAENERLRDICATVRNQCIDLASVGPVERGHAFATFWPSMNDALRSARKPKP